MSKNTVSTTRSGGIGFLGMLTILFIGLKLTGFVTWSWWWVLSPLWIVWAVVFGFFAIIGLTALVVAVYEAFRS